MTYLVCMADPKSHTVNVNVDPPTSNQTPSREATAPRGHVIAGQRLGQQPVRLRHVEEAVADGPCLLQRVVPLLAPGVEGTGADDVEEADVVLAGAEAGGACWVNRHTDVKT